MMMACSLLDSRRRVRQLGTRDPPGSSRECRQGEAARTTYTEQEQGGKAD